MSTSYWLDRTPTAGEKNYDVVIVGAGISGLSSAYWINQEDPSLKVAIIEKSRVGFGASGRNAGFITCGSVEHFNRMINKHGLEQATAIWKFSETNLHLLKEHIIEDGGAELEFEHNGAYSLAAQPNEFEELKSVAATMNKLKIQTEIFTADEIRERVGPQGFVGGIKYVDDASVNPVKLLNKLRLRVKADIFEGVEAYKIEQNSSGTRILKTDAGDFEAPMILMNLNGFSSNLHPWFKDKIYATRAQCLMFEPVKRFMDGPCYANFYLDYFRQLPTGQLLIGGFRQIEKETEVGYSEHITEPIQNALHEFVVKHLPQYTNAKVTHRWGGIMGFARDGEPMIGSIPDDQQIFFAGGYTGHGMGLAFHTGKQLVNLIFGREVPPWLSARRF